MNNPGELMNKLGESMKFAAAAILAFTSVVADASDTARIDRGIVTTGMNIAEVLSKAGQPSRVVTLENARGGAVGERWEYYRGRKLIALTISGGRVLRIDES